MPDDDLELCILDDIDPGREVVVPEAAAHDLNVWPHMHPSHLMDAMFPTAVAAPEVETVAPEDLNELGQLHRRWAAHRITVTRG